MTKRSYHQMMDQTPLQINMEGIAYHDFSQGAFYSPQQPPPPPQTVLFSNPFPSPNEYDGYMATADTMGYFQGNRSLSEPFIHQPHESFGSTSDSSSCNVSLGPATPPPATFKYAPVPITPSQTQPRQKAKRTATACEECRKRKQKCDGETPCQTCKEQKLDCKYREVTPTKKDNSIEKLFTLVENCSKVMEALNKRLDAMSGTIDLIERRLSRCWQCGSTVELETGTCHSCSGQVQCRL